MKQVWFTLPAAVVLAACATPADNTRAVGRANPASEYCVAQGGRLEIRQDAQGGEYGLCHLPDGRVVEEWALFRNR